MVKMQLIYSLFSIQACVLINLRLFASHGLTCKDDSGKPVDWHITYKLPKLDSTNPIVDDGTAYFYLGQNNISWSLSKKSITQNDTSFGFTLSPVYEKEKSKVEFYFLYNDEDPNGPVSSYRGHTKGVVAFDNTSGFWLIHSIPKFPPHTTNQYKYPKNGEIYGQSGLCITLNVSEIQKLSSLLYFNDPCVYDFYLPDAIALKYPLLKAISKQEHVSQSPWNQTLTLTTPNNISFQAFAKYKNFDKDLYSSWLAPYLGTNLLTETWQNEHGKLPSDCSKKWTVQNIKQISFESTNISFKSTRDHSKFAVANGSLPWTCIGDINRVEPQKRRGGGTVCINSPVVWKNYHQLVTKVESCNEI
uniref:Uncharacterized protein n=1 Tax=Strigamia maritima TaxID=126957 RepID=T1J7H6_STRMM